MSTTGIEYLTARWNPVAMKCDRVSDGCASCWALRMMNRMAANETFPPDVRAAYAGDGPPVLVQERLIEPLHWKKPRRVGVQFMGDLGHDYIPFEMIDRVLAVIALCPQHTFLMLTKRIARAVKYFKNNRIEQVRKAGYTICGTLRSIQAIWQWPSPNVILGTSIENQPAADERLPELAKLSAMGWKTWVSLEPMLGPVDLTRSSTSGGYPCGVVNGGCCPSLDWVVAGGESGPNARPCHPDWVRKVRDDCAAAGVPFYLKAWGDNAKFAVGDVARGCVRAGALLDGREHKELPQ